MPSLDEIFGELTRPRFNCDPRSTPEDCATGKAMYAKHGREPLVLNLFDGANAAQPWIDALAKALKKRLDEKGLPYNDKYAIALSISQPLGVMQPQEAGSTWPEYERVWIAADQPAIYVAATLAHELLHTAQPLNMTNDESHQGDFPAHAKALGLVGPWTGTQPGPEFEAWYLNEAPKPEDFR